jgi:hypothetical protein
LPFRLLLILALLLLAGTHDAHTEGYASAYAPGVMEGVVRVRFANDWWPVTPPYDWYLARGYVAVQDCRRVGEMATLWVEGESYRVLIADCGERGKPGEGQEWMRANNIVVELEWRLWEKLAGEHGTPLPVKLAE